MSVHADKGTALEPVVVAAYDERRLIGKTVCTSRGRAGLVVAQGHDEFGEYVEVERNDGTKGGFPARGVCLALIQETPK